MKLNLNDKIALVTGGSRGIGSECCKLLAEAGAAVIINFSKSGEEAEKAGQEIASKGGAADIFKADVSKPDEVHALFEHIKRKFRRLDILVNNAGIIKDKLLLNMEVSDWDKVQDVNLRGAFLCTRLAAEIMITQHSGKIINISSFSAIRGGRGQTNYAAAKGGLISFTRACAVELSGKGIQINAVLPGFIATDMTRRIIRSSGDEIVRHIPAGKIGSTEDIANVVVFLASGKADYITGQAISVDGGMSIL